MGGIILAGDLPDSMKARVVVQEVLGLARPQYNLRTACRVINMNKLTAKIPIATKLAAQKKVPALTEAEIIAQAYSEIDFDLWKNVVHVVIAKETELKGEFDILKLHTEDAAKALAEAENEQIADELETLTGTAGSDWGTSAVDPMVDIATARAAVETLGYNPDYMLMDPNVYAAFVANPNIKETFERGALVDGRISAFAGLKILVDSKLTANQAWILDSKAPTIVLGDGPTMVSKYDGQAAFFTGWAIAKFLEPLITISDAAVKLTGVTT